MSVSAPTYTQHTVAFWNVPFGERVVEEINLEFPGAGPGFSFRWIEIGGTPALQVSAFDESFANLVDDRMIRVLAGASPGVWAHEPEGSPSPDEVIRSLEREGFVPSRYHMEGLVRRGLSLDEKAAMNERMEGGQDG